MMNIEDTTSKPKPKVAFFVALGLFALVNVALWCVRSMYEPPIDKAVLSSSMDSAIHTREWTWWLARKWLEQKTPPDIVVFGSSQMGSASCAADAQHLFQVVDALTHRHIAILESDLQKKLSRPVSVFNLASPGQMCSDAYMASKALFTPDFHPKVVIVGVAPRDFIDNTLPYAASTEPFRFYNRFVSAGKLTWVAYNDLMSWMQFGLDSMPTRRVGMYLTQLESQLPSTKFDDSQNGGTALAAVLGAGAAEPGKWLVPANIPADCWIDNTKEYKNRFKNPATPVYSAERQFFDAFLASMQKRGIPVVVVGMPSLPMNRDLLTPKFWNAFRGNVSNMCAMHNAQFLDLTDSPLFVKEDYLDTIHLNAKGGSKLFNLIASYVAEDPLVAAVLNTDTPQQARTFIATPKSEQGVH